MFKGLKQHLTFRGASIDEIFKNIKGLGKYKDEWLAPEEYMGVFSSIEFKIEASQLKDVLGTMPQDGEGKVSYIEFTNEYKKMFDTP